MERYLPLLSIDCKLRKAQTLFEPREFGVENVKHDTRVTLEIKHAQRVWHEMLFNSQTPRGG